MTDGSWKNWALSSAGAIILLLIGVTLAAYDNRLDVIETRVVEIQEFHIDGNERLTRLETHYQHIDEQLDRIETKLDRERVGER